MYEGYFLEIEQYLAAAKFSLFFLNEYDNEEEREELLKSLDRARIALRDLIECIDSEG